MRHTHCPNCHQTNIEDFFTIRNAPVQSLVTVKTYEEAMAIGRQDINLSFCISCGFISNSTFDTTIDYYTKGYEDQQGFSPTFMKFITGIAQHLIDTYDIRNKEVIEIGCGKGDFLALICELGKNKGIGIDPAWEPGRNKQNPDLRFIKEFYSADHGKLNADFICCRHTLEHIHATKDFLQLIRNSLGTRTDAVLFFEIPQISRILDVQAFWDIFYEHCSYFSAGSLARLFRSTGFEILDLYHTYNDQYLMIEAKPVNSPSSKTFPIEESIEEQKARVENFKVRINQQLNEWRNRLSSLKANGKKTVVWGGGSKSVGFLTNFADLNLIEYVVDINPHMENNFIPGIGRQYVQPKFLKDYKPDTVIIMNGVYKDEITKTLNEMDVFPEIYTL
jgi:SAM-dependent methyltransferase